VQIATPHPLLRLTEIRKSFTKDGRVIEVHRGVDFELGRGESVSIMGRSGAGKTTLLQVIGTLDRPTSGTVEFDGRDVFAMRDAELSTFRGRAIGFVFQFHHLLPEFTTLENAAMPALIARMPKAAAFARAERLLTRVGLADRLGHRPGELSGGEQQRVAVARALVMEPSLLLADEPTGNLDAATGEAIFELFREIAADLGTSIIVVTHNDALADRMATRLQMIDGVLSRRVEEARA
jgi:lipoprotein-releasing system ATP-binding protein